MKKFIPVTIVAIIAATSLFSCKKTTAEQIVGRYSYKMSGSFDATRKNATGDTVFIHTFAISNQWGQMYVTSADENDNFIINMSAFMGQLLTFSAHLKSDTLSLLPHDITIDVTEAGTSSSLLSSTIPIKLTFQGQSKNYGNTLMFMMKCNGDFYMEDDLGVMRHYTVDPTSCDITCFGEKE